MKITLLDRGFYVLDLQWAVRSHPELWNEHTARTESENSPHYGLDDIWLRFADSGGVNVGGQEHESVWYHSAEILDVRRVVEKMRQRYNCSRLGGVLMTRVPPGATCKPHQDRGWHAETYDKYALQVESAPGQKFCFDDEELETRP